VLHTLECFIHKVCVSLMTREMHKAPRDKMVFQTILQRGWIAFKVSVSFGTSCLQEQDFCGLHMDLSPFNFVTFIPTVYAATRYKILFIVSVYSHFTNTAFFLLLHATYSFKFIMHGIAGAHGFLFTVWKYHL